ncbi:hypothetical protein SAMD00019534_002220 [Acytostelium subglobosum LB1]|uniref:hypothetical protein n=1 Tax=Acytostelium subglobosum LB1 TaxID=1410327 RepID=UPI0006450FC0|nr:hypothetical protein SAMD00019534_002220 [Acytostelium subglobosum LB1]GAM17047.1 hypothetical protein SAMD00019534_002220 [Acytostelium subglobosum LB1]|eukprot:XP_012759109.1 hypothetical protein SAMD00019534_002220 [Acytostelium subglobosum LB1]
MVKMLYHPYVGGGGSSYQHPIYPSHFFRQVDINGWLFDILLQFGNGSNKVFLCMDSESKELRVCKQIDYATFTQKQYDRIFTEIAAMQRLRHCPHIVKYINHYRDPEIKRVYIVMEYCEGGDLHQYIQDIEQSNESLKTMIVHHSMLRRSQLRDTFTFVNEETIWKHCSELLNILTTLDNHSIIHFDIKPGNIFLKNNQLVLGDFGCSKIIDDSDSETDTESDKGDDGDDDSDSDSDSDTGSGDTESSDQGRDHRIVIEISNSSNNINNNNVDNDTMQVPVQAPMTAGGICEMIRQINLSSISDTSSGQSSGIVGTLGYLALEVAQKADDIDSRADIYSVGSTILRLLSCHPDDERNHSLIEDDRDNVVISEQRYSADLREFVKSLLQAKREDRATLQKILKHAHPNVTYGQKTYVIYINMPFVHPIPDTVERLYFLQDFNQPIERGTLPASLLSIKFDGAFNQPIWPGTIPCSVRSIKLHGSFNQPIIPDSFPASLQVLSLSSFFDRHLAFGSLPEHLEHLSFGKEFNQVLPVGTLPSTLKFLRFGDQYNQVLPVGALPSALECLRFGDEFNQALPAGTLSSSLRQLVFGKSFKQLLGDCHLPEHLAVLVMSWYYKDAIPRNVLPAGLRELVCRRSVAPTSSVPRSPASALSKTNGHSKRRKNITTSAAVPGHGGHYPSTLTIFTIWRNKRFLNGTKKIPTQSRSRSSSGTSSTGNKPR